MFVGVADPVVSFVRGCDRLGAFASEAAPCPPPASQRPKMALVPHPSSQLPHWPDQPQAQPAAHLRPGKASAGRLVRQGHRHAIALASAVVAVPLAPAGEIPVAVAIAVPITPAGEITVAVAIAVSITPAGEITVAVAITFSNPIPGPIVELHPQSPAPGLPGDAPRQLNRLVQ